MTRQAGSRSPALALPARDKAIGGYDAVILALGNSEFHAAALRLLRTWDRPVVVHAHDVRMTNLYLHGSARGAVPEGFPDAVAAQYPDLSPELLIQGRLADSSADSEGVYMFREIAARADRLFVTSDFAAGLARLDADPSDGEKVAVWPYAYPRPVDRDAAQVDRQLICSFGLVNAAKAPELLIDAATRLLASRPGLRLAFVGPIADDEADRLGQHADAVGLGEAMLLTGRVDQQGYEDWLARAGLAVQLRSRSNGETSGAVADSLVHGVPTVVTDIGPQSGLGDVVVRVAADIDAAGLAAALARLIDDPDRATILGRRGRQFAADRGFDWAARQLLELLPELR